MRKKKLSKKIKALLFFEGVVGIVILIMVALLVIKSVKTSPSEGNLESSLTETEGVETEPTKEAPPVPEETLEPTSSVTPTPENTPEATPTETPKPTETPEPTVEAAFSAYEKEVVSWNSSWQYAEYAKICTSDVVFYRSVHEGRPVICINAGHGTSGGSSVKTQCHPDGTPKVTGGTTGAGATSAVAVSTGTTMVDGTPEAVVTLKVALAVRDRLLDAGYSVLMIRESEDVQLDNIARTVFANNLADCHIAIHYDSTTNDKGAFYMSVPDVDSYRSMEPVASHWQEHHALGNSLITGLKEQGVPIFEGGSMEMDLTQTSYSTVASVDIEVGDRGSDYSDSTISRLADGLIEGIKALYPIQR